MDIKDLCQFIIDLHDNPNKISEETRFQIGNALIELAYDSLDEERKLIYHKAQKIFSQQECDTEVLSVLYMNYTSYGINTKEKIIAEHSKLYVPFKVTPAIEWTIDMLLKLNDKKENII